tara:strand:+ start:1187 stop:1516 length:330 start_codon:yes stop_codon:yes gene_type:complete
MKYLILLSLIFSINFAETTLTDEQLDALYQKIEVCKLYKQEHAVLKQQKENCQSILLNYEEALEISNQQIVKLEEINKDLVESQKGKWYESPYFVGILTFLLGTQLDFK